MKMFIFHLLILIALVGCMPGASDLKISMPKKGANTTSSVSHASVSSVQVINNQLVINGNGFVDVTNVKVNGNSLNEIFSIESKTATKIIANSIRAFSFDISKVFSLILSDANASATFAIDFSLCNATLNGKGFNCAAPVADKDVLAYDAVSGTWKPRPASGLNYLGTFDASTNPGSGPAIQPAGAYYVISDDGTIAAVSFAVGDWLVSNGSTWQKIDNSSAVLSVFGRNGAITAQQGDYTLDLLGDVSFPVAPVAGKVLKFDGTNWVAADDLSGGGAGSVTTTAIAAGAVTDAKIDTVSASKITGTLTSAQIADGSIVNADINAAAAIAYSKLNVPDGAIPAAKITGLPVLSSILAATITNGDTTHAPTGDAVYDALALKLGTTGGVLTIGTISGIPTPVGPSEAVNKSYVDTEIANIDAFTEVGVLGTDLAGLNTGVNGPITAADTVLGAFGKMQYQVTDLKAKGQWDKTVNDISYSAGNVSIDKKLRLKSDNANYVEMLSPTSLAATYTLTLPGNDGNANQVLKTDGAGVLAWVDVNDATVQSFAKSALPTCAAGEVLKSNGTTFSCITDSTGAAAFSGTANKVVITTAGGTLGVSATTSTELGYVNGVTSAIQTQIDGKQAMLGFTPVNKAGDSISSGTFTFSGTAALRAADPVAATDVVNKQYFESFGQWTKNGSDIYRSSNVGIGISNPTSKLQVQDGKIFTTGAASYYQVGLDTSDSNLGKISFHASSQNTTNRYWTGLAYNNSGGSLSIGGGDALNLNIDSGSSVNFGSHVFRKVGWDGTNRTFTESMRIDQDGDVGIGTAAPKSKLDVNGAIRVGVDAVACSATIAGAMRFNTPNVEFCNGTTWAAFGVSNAAVVSSQITDGTIADADVNAAANITATKLGTGVVDNTEFNYLNGVTSSIQTQINAKQALDATLTALAGHNTNGILVQTAADTFTGRTVMGTTNRVTVTNGDGVAGNPTLNIPTALLPSPVVGDVGKFLKATAADTSVWTALGLSDVTTALGYTPINKAGDSISTGTFTLSGTAVMRSPDPIGLTDVANRQWVESYITSTIGTNGQWTKGVGGNIADIYFNTGNIGIGTNSPTQQLSVVGNVSVTGEVTSKDFFQKTVTIADGWAVGDYVEIVQALPGGAGVSSNWEIHLSGTRNSWTEGTTYIISGSHAGVANWREAPHVSESGYIGASKCFTVDTHPNSNAPKFRIRAIKASAACGAAGNPLPINFRIRSIGSNSSWTNLSATGTGATVTGMQSMGLSWNVYTGNPQNNGVLALHANALGNVGIGTASPSSKLHISSAAGNVTSAIERPAGSFGLLQLATTGSGRRWELGADNVAESGSDAGSNLGLWAYGDGGAQTQILSVTRSSGNVGMGTTVPGAKLEINAGTAGTAVDLVLNTSSVGAHNYLFFKANGTIIGSVTSAAGANVAYNTTSDVRLKGGFTPINGALGKVNQIEVSNFYYLADPKTRMDGFKAQQLYSVAPYAVTRPKVDVEKNGKINPWLADYSKVVPLITGAVQELSQWLSRHDREIASLKEENKMLKSALCKKDPDLEFCK